MAGHLPRRTCHSSKFYHLGPRTVSSKASKTQCSQSRICFEWLRPDTQTLHYWRPCPWTVQMRNWHSRSCLLMCTVILSTHLIFSEKQGYRELHFQLPKSLRSMFTGKVWWEVQYLLCRNIWEWPDRPAIVLQGPWPQDRVKGLLCVNNGRWQMFHGREEDSHSDQNARSGSSTNLMVWQMLSGFFMCWCYRDVLKRWGWVFFPQTNYKILAWGIIFSTSWIAPHCRPLRISIPSLLISP